MHARAGQLFWPCSSVGDLKVYLLYKFDLIWTKNKKVSLICTFIWAKIQTHVHARACIFRKNDYRSEHLQTLDYHPGKFHIDPLISFWEHSRTKKYRRRKRTTFGEHKYVALFRTMRITWVCLWLIVCICCVIQGNHANENWSEAVSSTDSSSMCGQRDVDNAIRHITSSCHELLNLRQVHVLN
jgi:hypothetical protein